MFHTSQATFRPSFDTLMLDPAGWEGEISRSSHDYVRWVQASLNSIDGTRLAVDGISGPMTRSAVRSFQSRRGLAADGVVGPQTEAALIRAGAPQPPGSAPVPAPVPIPAAAPSPDSYIQQRARLRVPESAITSVLPAFAAFTYGTGRYPWQVPGARTDLVGPPQETNCCCFAEALLWRAWSQQHGAAFTWNLHLHEQFMIQVWDRDRFGPVNAAVQAHMAVELPEGTPPTGWCIGQGWWANSPKPFGHTFIVVARHAPTDRVLILESTNVNRIYGVGYRNFGNLAEFPNCRPPARWWEDPRAPTWAGVLRGNPYGMKLGALGVTGASWAGLPA